MDRRRNDLNALRQAREHLKEIERLEKEIAQLFEREQEEMSNRRRELLQANQLLDYPTNRRSKLDDEFRDAWEKKHERAKKLAQWIPRVLILSLAGVAAVLASSLLKVYFPMYLSVVSGLLCGLAGYLIGAGLDQSITTESVGGQGFTGGQSLPCDTAVGDDDGDGLIGEARHSLFEASNTHARIHPNPTAVVNSYIRGKYSGNILDILEPKHSIYPYVIENGDPLRLIKLEEN